MNRISISYTLKYELDFASEYQWSDNKICFNIKTGRKIKQVYNSGSIGYVIRGRFYSLKLLRQHLRKIKEINCPF